MEYNVIKIAICDDEPQFCSDLERTLIKILDKNKGIVLAENNYLPVDKRGNVNVLVVGRIRFW